MKTINNCENCQELEYVEWEDFDLNGYVCNKMNYKNIDDKDAHYSKLDKKKYRLKPKKCCILKNCIENGSIAKKYPKHNTDSDECWCNPVIEDLENGSRLIIHNNFV